MKALRLLVLVVLASSFLPAQNQTTTPKPATPTQYLGFRDKTAQAKWDQIFLAAPDPKLAEDHLKTLTAAPHLASTPEDRKTADYVAQKFREAGLQTEIVEYRVMLNLPEEISVDLVAPPGVTMHGPTREHVDGDPFQDDPRVAMPFNGLSPSGDVEADVVYANYGRPEDFDKLAELGVDVKGKIVVVRYGQNFRGVKAYVAQQRGAAGVIIYSDPIDDGYFKGDMYPNGPWRPETGVQRGAIQYMFIYPGDVTTPGVASTPDLPESKRVPLDQAQSAPRIPTTPLSYHDAAPILAHLAGPDSPREWQGALPFTYHVGPGPARLRVHLKQNYALRPIWDVIGTIPGSATPNEWVVAGNHRDAWVYGAVDPNSGTAAMLETVHGLGALLKAGWKPKRTIVIASWDAEEEGLIGSTEWGEQHEKDLANADAYFNVDVAVSGPNFSASAVPSLKEFIRDVTKAVPSPKGGMLYDVWKDAKEKEKQQSDASAAPRTPKVQTKDVPVGDLGSGSDYTVFIQHLGVPASDIGSNGPYGVYHSTFDDFSWFKKNADPDFKYEQEMAQVFGMEIIRMAGADVLPYDYAAYGDEIQKYLDDAEKKAQKNFGAQAPSFEGVKTSAKKFREAGEKWKAPEGDPTQANDTLRRTERAFLMAQGLPHRAWFRHAIYAPGEYTGYAAVVIPGVNEAIDAKDLTRTVQQLQQLTAALDRATKVLSGK